MTKLDRIIKNINQDKTLLKKINNESFYSIESFIESANRYIKAIKEGRMICSIDTVSASGMSCTIKFLECSKGKDKFNYLNFFMFFKILDFTPANRHSHYFRISGCGMDMIFHTNYTIIHKLTRLGFINNKQCQNLAQQTPNVI